MDFVTGNAAKTDDFSFDEHFAKLGGAKFEECKSKTEILHEGFTNGTENYSIGRKATHANLQMSFHVLNELIKKRDQAASVLIMRRERTGEQMSRE